MSTHSMHLIFVFGDIEGFAEGLKYEFESATVITPSVFESFKYYCYTRT